MEFKRLSDVEVVAEPAESANVLIEEDGVIKKAPKTAVGGGGEWDAIIEIIGGTDVSNADSVNLISGSYDTVKAKLDNGELPKVLIRWDFVYGVTFRTCIVPNNIFYNMSDTEMYYDPQAITMIFDMPRYTGRNVVLHPDNTISA